VDDVRVGNLESDMSGRVVTDSEARGELRRGTGQVGIETTTLGKAAKSLSFLLEPILEMWLIA
jgi:hypothetical protein